MDLVIFSNKIQVFADETANISGTVMTVNMDVSAYEKPDENSSVIVTFKAGENVFVTEKTDEWLKIFYQGKTAYINRNDNSADEIASVAEASINESLEAEFKQKEQFDITYVDSFERQQKRNRNAMIWKIVIGVLVLAIVAISVIIAVKNMRNGSDDTKNPENDQTFEDRST